MKSKNFRLFGAGILFSGIALLSSGLSSAVNAQAIADTGFESGDSSGWTIGTQTGTLANGTITGSGTGVTIISGAVAFNAPSHGAVGSPTSPSGGPNPYYQPAVTPATWSFVPFGTHAAALQPMGAETFDAALSSLGISQVDQDALRAEFSNQASASGYGSGKPTNAAWITRTVDLQAGTTYTMSWNYIGTDYVPYNDGSITSLVPVSVTGQPTISVNNSGSQYAMLGFTNPGTGDYSTGTYGSTGWQVSTYQVSISGQYLLGFAVFNLDDTALSPVLLVDSQPGTTLKNGEQFGAVAPNNPEAPTVPPATTQPPVTEPPVTEPPTTEPPVTEPPATEPPTTEAPVTEPPATTEPEEPSTSAPETVETTTPVPPVFFPVATEPPTDSTEPVVEPTPESIPATQPPAVLPVTGSSNSSSISLGLWFVLLGACLLGISFFRKQRA